MHSAAWKDCGKNWVVKYRHLSAASGVLILCLASTSSLAGQGDDAAFFQQRSQNAYNAVFGLPTVAPRFVRTAEWQISVEHSNQYAGGDAGNERLRLDGETSRLAVRHRRRIGACWQIDTTLPLISHSGGVFDDSIDNWHQYFGFPDANRDTTAFDNLTYYYADGVGIRHNVARAQSGVGDIRLAVQHSLKCSAGIYQPRAQNMVRVGIKLPTGNPAELRGSGTVDAFVDWQSPVWEPLPQLHTGMAMGVLVNGPTNRFAKQRPIVGYGSLGAQIVVHRKFRLIAQIDAHSGFYESNLVELGNTAVNLAVGFRYLFDNDYTFEISISEDLAIDTTPDIVARLALIYRPE